MNTFWVIRGFAAAALLTAVVDAKAADCGRHYQTWRRAVDEANALAVQCSTLRQSIVSDGAELSGVRTSELEIADNEVRTAQFDKKVHSESNLRARRMAFILENLIGLQNKIDSLGSEVSQYLATLPETPLSEAFSQYFKSNAGSFGPSDAQALVDNLKLLETGNQEWVSGLKALLASGTRIPQNTLTYLLQDALVGADSAKRAFNQAQARLKTWSAILADKSKEYEIVRTRLQSTQADLAKRESRLAQLPGIAAAANAAYGSCDNLKLFDEAVK